MEPMKASMDDLGAALAGGSEGDPESRMLMRCVKNGDAKGLKQLIRGMVMDVLDEDESEVEAGPPEMEY